MKILELFSGTECLSNAFRARGHECFTVDWDRRFPSSLHIDIMQLTAERILADLTCRSTSVATRHSHQARLVPLHSLLHRFGRPDIIWAGCDCTTFSVAAIGHHRRKDPATGSLAPKTEKAARADDVNRHTLRIIRSLRPRFFFIENPMGGLRKMDYMRGIPRHLITYCQYGFTYRKATDIWTNHPRPEFLPPCRNGDPCHQPAPRGTFELSRQTGLRRKPKGRLSESRRKPRFQYAEREDFRPTGQRAKNNEHELHELNELNYDRQEHLSYWNTFVE